MESWIDVKNAQRRLKNGANKNAINAHIWVEHQLKRALSESIIFHVIFLLDAMLSSRQPHTVPIRHV